jgi:hypothetical protein
MPKRVDVFFVLLADYDPVDDTLATIGFLRRDKTGERSVIEVIGESNPNREADALVKVFEALTAELFAIDVHNLALSESDPNAIYAHIFVYEPAEAVSLQNAVGRHLNDSRVRIGLLNLVRIFPPEEVIPEPEFRGMHHLPATALRTVIEQLYAVPSLTAYDLRQVSAAIAKSTSSVRSYCPNEDFERPFSSLLSIDVIRRLRDPQRKRIDRSLIESDVRARLESTVDIAAWLIAQNKEAKDRGSTEFLRLSKKPFRFQSTFNPLGASDLDVLQAFELLENRAGLLSTLVDLAQSADQRCDAGRCIAKLKLLKRWNSGWRHFMLFSIPPESRESDIAASDFDLILTDDDPDIRLDPQLWPIFECRLHERGPQHAANSLLISVTKSQGDDPTFNAMRNRAGEGPFFVDRIFKDFNTSRSASFLRYLASQS